jgi:hypothetical protein
MDSKMAWLPNQHHGCAVGVPLASVLLAHSEDGGAAAATCFIAVMSMLNRPQHDISVE